MTTMTLQLPDRLSVHVGDPGFAQYQAMGERRLKILVFLDGVEQKDVETADRLQGWIRRMLVVDGRPVLEGGRIKSEVVKGMVEFRFKGEPA